MTTENARKLIGTYGKNLTDEQVQAIVECFSTLIEVGFQQFEQQYKQEKKMEACNGARTVQ